MIRLVIHNLKCSQDHQFIFICLKKHIDDDKIDARLKEWVPNCKIIPIDQVTEGAACTVLLAEELINNDDPMMIANSDQWVDASIDDYLKAMENGNWDGFIMTMTADDPKWSFVRLDENKNVTGVVEKEVVSNEATVGIYNYKHGRDFVKAAHQMILKNLRVNNEFYVAPVYNEMIERSKGIGYYNVGREAKGMYGMGKPEDLDLFVKLPISKRAAIL